MYEIKITSAEPINVQETGEDLLAVGFDIVCDGVVVASLNHGLPLGSTADDVKAYLKTVKEGYAANAARSALLVDADKAAQTAASLVGETI